MQETIERVEDGFDWKIREEGHRERFIWIY